MPPPPGLNFIYYLCVYTCVGVSTCVHEYMCLSRPEEGFRSLDAGVSYRWL